MQEHRNYTVFKAILKLISICLTVFSCVLLTSSITKAQDDPNAQYIVLHSGTLTSSEREIEIPVEVGVLRLQFSVQFSGELGMTIISPLGEPIILTEPNIAVTETKDRRTIAMWDPKPGRWKMRLSGSARYNASVTVQGELYVCCMQFYGRNGIYTMDRFQPLRGSRQQAQVYASGFNVETIGFHLINEEGEMIGPLKFRQSDYSNPSGFTLLIDTPNQPYRVLARGRDINGKIFQRVFHPLVRPQTEDPSTTQSENSPAVTINNQTLQDLNKEFAEDEQMVIRTQVLKWSDEQLFSEKGSPIGIRLKYSMMFPVEGSYSPLPQLYPERIGYGYTGALAMRIHMGLVEPLPEGIQNPSQLAFGARATFKPGIVYSFTVDLVPNYTIYNEQKKIFCLQTKPYNQQGIRERFEREVMSELKLRFRFSISGTDLDGRQPTLTANTYMPNLWYQTYKKEGATDCQ